MSGDVERMAAEINELCASWPGAIDEHWPARKVSPTTSYVSKVPQALNCINRAAKDGSAAHSLDELYETKYRVLLVCARLGWAREASEGYQVDRFLFHCPAEIDCSVGNETRYINLDNSKIDDYDRAYEVLEVFLESHPLTPDEEKAVEAYRQTQEQERLAYEARRAMRSECYGDDDLEDLDDDFGDLDDDLDDFEV